MSKLPMIARYLLGLVLTVFGLNGFFGFMPPPDLPPEAMGLMGAIVESGYLMTLVKIVEVLTGIALLTNRFVPLMLVVFAPVGVNIVAFHLFLAPAPGAIAPGALVFILNWYLLFANKDKYEPLLKASPESGDDSDSEG